MKAKICHSKVPFPQWGCCKGVAWPISTLQHFSWRHTSQGCHRKGELHSLLLAELLSSLWWYFFFFFAFSDFHTNKFGLTESKGSRSWCKTSQVLVTDSSQTEQGLPAEPGFPQNNRKWDTDLAPWLKPQEKRNHKKDSPWEPVTSEML